MTDHPVKDQAVTDKDVTHKDFVVSGDGHVLEPTDLFKTRLPKHLRDRAVWEEDFELDEPMGGGRGTVVPASAHRRLRGLDHLPVSPDRAAARQRATRSRILEDMAEDGVDVQVMHPNLSLFGLYSDDHELSIAHARVYNDYIVERFTPYFDRLVFTAPIPLTDVDDAVAEIERVAAAGFRAILLPATPPTNYYTRDLDPVWAAASANGVQPFFHTQTGGVRVADTEAVTLKVVLENAAQVNQPMTDKAAAKRMVTQAVHSAFVPAAAHVPPDRRRRAGAVPRSAVQPHRVQRPLVVVAGRRHGQVLGHRHRPGRGLVARHAGTTRGPPTTSPTWPSSSS